MLHDLSGSIGEGHNTPTRVTATCRRLWKLCAVVRWGGRKADKCQINVTSACEGVQPSPCRGAQIQGRVNRADLPLWRRGTEYGGHRDMNGAWLAAAGATLRLVALLISQQSNPGRCHVRQE